MKLTATLALAAGLAIPALAPNVAEAADCFILVHGNKGENLYANPAEAVKYWSELNGASTPTNFINVVTAGTAHYGIVRWNSTTSTFIPFWHDEAAGEVARQIEKIQLNKTVNGSGNATAAPGQLVGDGFAHDRQCVVGDKFYVIAHSQGAQVMTYINGNSKSTDPNFNKSHIAFDATRDARDLTPVKDAKGNIVSYKLYSNTKSAPFSSIMTKVTAVITIGGAINGTEGMDDVCNGGLDATLLSLVGKTCVPSLQTYARYNPSSFTGPSMLRPTYNLGGYGDTPISYTTLTGEDDGVVNLASQMNCVGDPTRDLENDLKEWWYGVTVHFTCNGANKRHSNSFNLATINITHNAEVTAAIPTFGSSWTHNMKAASVLNCGDGKNVPETIRACLTQIK